VRPSQRRSILVGLVLGAVATATAAFLIGRGSGDSVAHIDQPGTGTAPAASSAATTPTTPFQRFDGRFATFADYRGKPLVVNFWSTTCAPCVKEMPALQQVHQAEGDRIGFLGIDVNDSLDDGTAFAAKTGVTYDLARDPRAELVPAFGGTVLPTTVLIAADGSVAETHSGALTADELTAAIRAHFG